MSDYDSFLTQPNLRCMMGDRVYHTFPITIDILVRIFSHFNRAMFFMPACVQLFWSHFSHFSEFQIWFRILCLKSNLAPVSSFVVGILLSQPLVLIFTFLRRRSFSSSKRSWRCPFLLFLTPFCVR